MQHAVAVGAQRDALLDFFHCCRKTPVGYEFVDALFVRASDNVMEVDNRRVLQTAVGAFLRSFKLVPRLLIPCLVNAGGLNMLFFVLLVPVVSVLLLFFFTLEGVFVWH